MNIELRQIGNKCNGCELCQAVCPTNAISFIMDEEGFRYPQIDDRKCINCDACIHKCPIHSPQKYRCDIQEAYAGYSNDMKVVAESSSGGVFFTLSKYFLDRGDKVAAVVWSPDFCCTEHILINNMSDLHRLIKSKYIQSKKASIYKDVVKALGNSRVLFVGSPCEVTAMKSYCPEKLLDHLFTVDFVCQGSTSEKAMADYVKYIEKKYGSRIKDVNMRFKIGPWIPQYLRIEFENKRILLDRLYDTEIGDSIKIMQRPSCYECEFVGKNRCSDLTMGDYHGADQKASYYNESGISILVANSSKGKELIDIISHSDFYLENADYAELVSHNPRMDGTWARHKDRDKYVKVFAAKGVIKASRAIRTPKETVMRMIPIGIRLKLKEIFKLKY